MTPKTIVIAQEPLRLITIIIILSQLLLYNTIYNTLLTQVRTSTNTTVGRMYSFEKNVPSLIFKIIFYQIMHFLNAFFRHYYYDIYNKT